jgi:hypothetical protein
MGGSLKVQLALFVRFQRNFGIDRFDLDIIGFQIMQLEQSLYGDLKAVLSGHRHLIRADRLWPAL